MEKVNVENFDGSKQVGILYRSFNLIRIIIVTPFGIPMRVFRYVRDFKKVSYE